MVHQLGEWGVTEMFFLPRVDFADLMNEWMNELSWDILNWMISYYILGFP